jgi:peptide/nickel transport system substrate-binding protein
MIDTIALPDQLWLDRHPAWKTTVQRRVGMNLTTLVMNTEMPPFDDVHVRRAVALALDRDAYARSFHGQVTPLHGLFVPGLPGFDEHLDVGQRYSLEAARRELALAGHPDGWPDEIEMLMPHEGGEVVEHASQLVQADLARVGLRVRLRPVDAPVYFDRIGRRRSAAMSLVQFFWDYPDPSNLTESLFHSRFIRPEGSSNVSFYSNPRLDALLDDASRETARDARLALYHEAERIIAADAPMAFVFSHLLIHAVQPYVRGYHINPTLEFDYRDVWLDQPVLPWGQREHARGGP